MKRHDFKILKFKNKNPCWALVAHACNPSYKGHRDQEVPGLRPARANSSQDPISKLSTQKRADGEAQVIEHLTSMHEARSSNPVSSKNK
jgi:hypothetical protein